MNVVDIKTPELRQQLNFLVLNWNSPEILTSDVLPEDAPQKHWWEFWKLDSNQKNSIQNIFRYMLEGLDDFVKILFKKYGSPTDHQDEIISAISSLYDNVVVLPFWLKPLSSKFKEYFMLIIPICVAFLDSKYKGINL